MGDEIVAWRRRIGSFAFRSGNSVGGTSRKNNRKTGDFRMALFLASLLVIVGSTHPNPGPPKGATINKRFESETENQLFNSIRKLESKLVRMESHLNFFAYV